MFGFLRPAVRSRAYRQVYATLCAFQRCEYGILSTPFVSYEAIFLYLLAIDLGVCTSPASDAPTCCRFRSDTMNRWQLDRQVASFCSGFALLLATVKLEDDVRDHRSLTARAVRRLLADKIDSAKQTLDQVAPHVCDRVQQQVARHIAMERAGRPVPMQLYTDPTSAAFAEIFAAFGCICSSRGREVDLKPIGAAIGQAIIAADCAFDYDRDVRYHEYTPLGSHAQRMASFDVARRALVDAGWYCVDVTEPRSAFAASPRLTLSVLSDGLQRILKLRDRIERGHQDHLRPSRRSGLSRRGDCDCLGDCLADFCGQAACDAANPSCCECADPDCILCCDAAPCEFCVCNRRKGSDEVTKQHRSDASSSLSGKTGEVTADLRPTGFVEIDGQEYPARSQGQVIRQGERVTVLSQNEFGIIAG